MLLLDAIACRAGRRVDRVDQEVSGALHTPVVGRGLDVEEAAHQGVDVHLADGGRLDSLAEVGPPREEDGFHGGELVAVAVVAFLVLSLLLFHVLKAGVKNNAIQFSLIAFKMTFSY